MKQSNDRAVWLMVSVWLFFVIGWVLNLVKAYNGVMSVDRIGDISTTVWVQVVAIFMGPIGSIMGYVVW